MEYDNPWGDKTKITHKNIKATKPEPRKPKEKQKEKLSEEETKWRFVEELVGHAFRKVNSEAEKKIRKTFGDSYDGAMSEVKLLKEEILGSPFLPDRKTKIFLGYLCMIRDAMEN